MTRRLSFLPALLTSLMLCLTAASHALDVSVLFQPAHQTGNPGDTLLFSAVFTNNTGGDVTFDFATLNLPSAPAGSESYITGYLNGGPFTIGTGETTQTDIFGIYLDPDLASDPSFLTTYDGIGAFSATTGDEVSNALSFTVSSPSSVVPEPLSVILFVAGGLPLLRLVRRRIPKK
jgi:hypothetical protein